MNTTYDVFRTENRAGGTEQHVGQVVASNDKEAVAEAEQTFECDEVHRLYVRPAQTVEAE